jgi:phosphatidate cytidylyltransferase
LEGSNFNPKKRGFKLNIEITSSLKTRLISGFILAPLTLLTIYLGGVFFGALIFAAFIIVIFEWISLCKKTQRPILEFLVGFVYSIICIASFAYIRLGIEYGMYFCVASIVCVWASDVGAYFVGKKFRGPKIAPIVSPNKTLSGLLGAMFFSGIAASLFYINLPESLNAEFSIFAFFAGMVFGFIGQTGDLFISAAKRRANVKDTGNLIPGHGGLLDRIDSLMLVSPIFLSFVVLWVL